MSEVSGGFLFVCFGGFAVFGFWFVCFYGVFGGVDMLFSVGTASMSFNTNISDL